MPCGSWPQGPRGRKDFRLVRFVVALARASASAQARKRQFCKTRAEGERFDVASSIAPVHVNGKMATGHPKGKPMFRIPLKTKLTTGGVHFTSIDYFKECMQKLWYVLGIGRRCGAAEPIRFLASNLAQLGTQLIMQCIESAYVVGRAS